MHGLVPEPALGLAIWSMKPSTWWELWRAPTRSGADATAIWRRLPDKIAKLRAEERASEGAEQRLKEAWRSAVAPLGLTETATPEEVTAVIDLLSEIFHKKDERERVARRAALLETEARAFAFDVEQLAREHAPDLANRRPDEVADQLIHAYHQGQKSLIERRGIERQIDEIKRLLALQSERRDRARTSLDALMRAAGVTTAEALTQALRDSEEAATLDASLDEVARELSRAGRQRRAR